MKSICIKYFMILILIFGVLTNAIAETQEEEESRVNRIFIVIEMELDKIDLKQEEETDRTIVIIQKTLIGFGYSEDNSGILISGAKNGNKKFIYNIIVQIHEKHDSYEMLYMVDWDEEEIENIERRKNGI